MLTGDLPLKLANSSGSFNLSFGSNYTYGAVPSFIPHASTIVVEIVNTGTQPISFTLQAGYNPTVVSKFVSGSQL